jgi:hypothetical protein
MTSLQTNEQFGRFYDSFENSKEYLTLQFSVNSEARQERWRNYGLSADFLGDYFSNFFPVNELSDRSLNQKEIVKATVSFIANELLENAIKYTELSADEPISISLYLHEDHLVFRSINYANIEAIAKLKGFIDRILSTDDIDALFAEQLELTARGCGQSHMGFLTMMCDYGVEFGWRFQSSLSPNIVKVDVVAYLII